MNTQEFNFDGMVGPTHNYAGLSYGNVASSSHKSKTSHPKAAALQGLRKMKFVRDLGVGQCVLPPLLRPNLGLLRSCGLKGEPNSLVAKAAHSHPHVLASAYSASNMWTANAATVSPSVDCEDGRLHLTPANLTSKPHRAIEAPETTSNLRAIFSDESMFKVHDPLPAAMAFSDEGAANFMRLTSGHGQPGIEVFVWGRSDFGRYPTSVQTPSRFPARQTLEAFEAIAQKHGLDSNDVVYLHQNPNAIDAGVFHNDVIAVANENVILAHELAFVDRESTKELLSSTFESRFGSKLFYIEVKQNELSLEDTVNSYLFNSQLVTRADGGMSLICPEEVRENDAANACVQRMLADDNPIDAVEFLDLRQSMNNGGGPACLRLRVVLTDAQQKTMHQGVVLTDPLYDQLVQHVEKHYRDDLKPEDLQDPLLMDESLRAHEALSEIWDSEKRRAFEKVAKAL